jgi:hypothetical protein
MLEPLLPALMAVRAQRLQLAIPEFDGIVVVRLDMVRDACRDNSAFAQAHRAKRLALPCRATCPFNEIPLLIASASLYYQLAAFPFGNSTAQNIVSNTNEIFSAAACAD